MIDEASLRRFVSPYYEHKDIMHDLSHIERVIKSANKLGESYSNQFDQELVLYAAYFHGFIYSDENAVRKWLFDHGLAEEQVEKIIQIAWDSQKMEIPETLEGKILHDAYMIEGGKTYLVDKSLITGSVRGQTLEETIEFIEKNILDQGRCYLPEAQEAYALQQVYAKEIIKDLKGGLE